MVNLEESHYTRHENTPYSPLLGPSESNNDYLNTQFEDEHEMAFHCHATRASIKQNQKRSEAQKKLLITSVICLVFMIGEGIGGYAAHSLAVMTDAAHLLTDLGSILISLFSLWISKKPASKNLTFGWHRAEVLGALLSVMSIWTVTVLLLFTAIGRIITNDYEINSSVMLITSGCAVVVNVLMAFILHQSPVSHGHCHNHSSTSVRAAFIHVLGDLLQSLGVLLAATVIYFWPEWKVADPICTFLFSALVFATTFTILKDIFRVLMEGIPLGIDYDSVKDTLLSVRGVTAIHSLHIWTLAMSEYQMTVHAVIDEQCNPHTALMDLTNLLQAEFGFHNITIQIEAYAGEMADCDECQNTID